MSTDTTDTIIKASDELEKILFLIGVLNFILIWGMIYVEAFVPGKATPELITKIYLCVLGAYAAMMRSTRWGSPHKEARRRGEYFFVATWVLAVILPVCWFFSPDTVTLSAQIVPNIENVTLIFFGNEAIKGIDRHVNKTIKTP